ncbi:MAG: hypothetical protein GWN93_19380 [Deltaproteobacteria bacterium]|nr:hypothetical protein [Deltaproteobacteria bacterium]
MPPKKESTQALKQEIAKTIKRANEWREQTEKQIRLAGELQRKNDQLIAENMRIEGLLAECREELRRRQGKIEGLESAIRLMGSGG